jgi:lysozyme
VTLAEMLRRDEGVVRHAYQDHLGYWTIGVGRLIDQRKGGGLSEDEIDYLLHNDIRRKTAEVAKALPWLSSLNGARQAVLVGMAFQMGTEGLLKFKNTLAMVQAGDFEGAAKGMLQSLWARQTPERATRMAEQMRTGEWT